MFIGFLPGFAAPVSCCVSSFPTTDRKEERVGWPDSFTVHANSFCKIKIEDREWEGQVCKVQYLQVRSCNYGEVLGRYLGIPFF